MKADGPRDLVIASVLAEGRSAEDVVALFSGTGYGPAPLTEAERDAIASPPAGEPPSHVRGEYPDWLESELRRSFDERLNEEVQALHERAQVVLRVNTLRATRANILIGLRSLGIKAEPTPFAPDGIRIPSEEGLSSLQHTRFFQTGAFEFQDEASQIAALLCEAKPGEQILDLAAGAGGKALALAAQMQNRGAILAFDTDASRLKQLGPRARRAGTTIITATEKRGGPLWGNGKFDAVLVDAPCSGSGSWRRNPETKWRLTSERLKELIALQTWLIDDGARHTKPGGRLVYVTCSLLRSENEDVIEAFVNRQPGFRRRSAAEIWHSTTGSEPPPGMAEYFRASPLKTGTDGFFVCIMQNLG
jgi:16S rRNA (cytosine967-C5)-methyltransferase